MVKAAIMGCGTVGSGVYEVITANQAVIRQEIGEELRVARILDLREFPEEPFADLIVHNFEEIVSDPDIRIVVETMGGIEPAYGFVKRALLAGKHVVTSNKALVAAHGTELLSIARRQDVNFFFEAAVGGGIPVIQNLSSGYAGQRITRISGILNGTTNYILTQMDHAHGEFASALSEAQRLGYAEQNPEADVEGDDSCRKIAILASLMMGCEVRYENIHTEGITNIRPSDFFYARRLGASIKLIAAAERREEGLELYVFPQLIWPDDPLYDVGDVFNGILIEGNMLGTTMLYGSGAGKLPTASAVVADMIEAVRNMERNKPFGWREGSATLLPWGEGQYRYLIRFDAVTPERYETITGAFPGAQILQSEDGDGFALFTEAMKEKELARMLRQYPEAGGIVRGEARQG